MTVEGPDSSCQPAKVLVPTPPTTDNSHIVQEAISLDFEEILENRVAVETSDNTQSTMSTDNKSNPCTMTKAYSTLQLSPNQTIIQNNEGSTPYIPSISHVSVHSPISISDSMSRNGIEPEGGPWNEDIDDFDSLMDEEALTKVDILCQETHELGEEEVDITKKTAMVSDEEDEILIISDDEELIQEDSGVKTLQDIAEEEEKDVYDPVVLGKMLIHCHLLFLYSSLYLFPYLPISLLYPFILHSIHPFIHSSFILYIHLSIHPSFYTSVYPFILLSIHPFINSHIVFLSFV